MSDVFVRGIGAVSPAGWGVADLRAALDKNVPLPTSPQARPGIEKPFQVRPVPASAARPAFLTHPRLRRTSPMAQQVVAAALEALDDDTKKVQSSELRLGIIVCTMAGSVAYSRRFYEEALREPATASPIIFPETVFNAAASHLSAYLNTQEISYSLIGDDGTFPQGLVLAAQWLNANRVDGCVVIGAEELDWVVADAIYLFHHSVVHASGTGALYLKRESAPHSSVKLAAITDSFVFTQDQPRAKAAQRMREQFAMNGSGTGLFLSAQNIPRQDAAELSAWADWTGSRLAPKSILGEAFVASAAWQCVAACDALNAGRFSAANVSIVGANEQAIGVRFEQLASGKS